MHVIERPITVHSEDSDKGTVSGEFFTDRPSIDILYYPEERDDKGELIKAGHYMLLRRAALLSQPEYEKVGDYVAVCSETTDWFMCVISEINDPSKEVKFRFMTNSSAVSLFLFNPSSQIVQHFYKEHNQTLQRDCQITSRKWRPIWLPS